MKSATAKIDPDAKVPAAVRAAAKLAEDRHKQVYSKPEEPKPAEEPTVKIEEPKVVETPETPDTTKPAETTPAPTAEAPPKETPASPPSSEEDTWKHKYHSMKGRFDRADSQIAQMSEQISQLQRLLAAKAAEPAPQPVASTPPVESLLTEEEVKDYGTEFLGVVGKKAKEVVSQEVRVLQAQVAQLTKQLESVGGYVAGDAQSRFYQTLDGSLPKWREINSNSNFISWLKLPDVYSGAIRHDLLKAAYERYDAPRVLAFFNGFLAQEAVVDPPQAGGDNGLSPGTPASAPPKVPLKDLAAPGRAKSPAATDAPAEKPIITRAQISQFYNDISAGKYRGKEAEKDRLERMIFDAEKDGRIR